MTEFHQPASEQTNQIASAILEADKRITFFHKAWHRKLHASVSGVQCAYCSRPLDDIEGA
jgi:hypothetical protein